MLRPLGWEPCGNISPGRLFAGITSRAARKLHAHTHARRAGRGANMIMCIGKRRLGKGEGGPRMWAHLSAQNIANWEPSRVTSRDRAVVLALASAYRSVSILLSKVGPSSGNA